MLQLLLVFFLCSRLAAGETGFDVPNAWLTSVIDTYPPGLGEPLNVVLSNASDPEVLKREGFEDWLNSIGYADQCLGLSAGNKQSVDLADGEGYQEQAGLYRWAYGFPQHGGTCWESLEGGSHVRYWFQKTTGAIFLAASNEHNASMNHGIIPNGYDLGRDDVVGNTSTIGGTTSPSSGVMYTVTSTYLPGYITPGFEGINHYVATDGRIAVLTVSILPESSEALSTSAIVIAAAFLPSTLVAVLLTFYLLYPKFDYPRPRLDPHPKDVHARRHAQLLAGLEEMRRAGVGRARSTIRRW